MYYVQASDGVHLAVYDYTSKGEDIVFLIHGWPLSSKIYEYQLNPLIEKGYRVVTMDLRGFGESDVPACGYSYDQMADDIYQVAQACKLDCFVLVGFSMGGAVALRYMNKFQGYGVKKLFLLSAAAPMWTKRQGYPYGLTCDYVNSLIRQAAVDRAQLAYEFSHKYLFACPKSNTIINWFGDIALSASGIGTIQTAISLRDEDGRKDLKSVCVPTVIIYGKKDAVVTKELIMLQHREIKGSVLYTLENSAHGIMYDELERFNNIFLKELACLKK